MIKNAVIARLETDRNWRLYQESERARQMTFRLAGVAVALIVVAWRVLS